MIKPKHRIYSRRVLAAVSSGVVFALFAPIAMAQTEGSAGAGEDTVIYRQRTIYSFDGDTIDGDLMRPDGAYIEARKELQHSNLIKVRDNFREKVLESVIYL